MIQRCSIHCSQHCCENVSRCATTKIDRVILITRRRIRGTPSFGNINENFFQKKKLLDVSLLRISLIVIPKCEQVEGTVLKIRQTPATKEVRSGWSGPDRKDNFEGETVVGVPLFEFLFPAKAEHVSTMRRGGTYRR